MTQQPELVARSGLVKAGLLRFKELPALAELDPGIVPHEFNVLVLPREIEAKTASGLVHLPDDKIDREQEAAMEAMLVRLSPAAFSYSEWPAGAENPAAPGAMVLFSRYSGYLIEGRDGRKYRLIKDKDVMAVLEWDRSEVAGAWE